jgi:hypothetical protein
MTSNRIRHVRLPGVVIGVMLVCLVFAGVDALADSHGAHPSAQDQLETILGRMEAATGMPSNRSWLRSSIGSNRRAVRSSGSRETSHPPAPASPTSPE